MFGKISAQSTKKKPVKANGLETPPAVEHISLGESSDGSDDSEVKVGLVCVLMPADGNVVHFLQLKLG